MLWLYALIFIALAAGLLGAYRLLGTPSRLTPRDYAVVLADVATSVERAAERLRQALADPDANLEDAGNQAEGEPASPGARSRPPFGGAR